MIFFNFYFLISVQDPSSSRFKPYKSRFLRAAEAQEKVHATGSSVFSGTSETGSVAGSASASEYSVSGYQTMLSMTSNDKLEVGVRVGMISPQNVKKPSLIVLKGKLGLPDGFGPLKPYQRLQMKIDEENLLNPITDSEDSDNISSIMLTSDALNRLTISNTKLEKERKKELKNKFKFKGGRLGRVKEGKEGNEDNSDDNSGDNDNDELISDDDEDDSDYEQETETVNTTASIMRMRGETPEQRKARKNLVSTDFMLLVRVLSAVLSTRNNSLYFLFCFSFNPMMF